MVAELKRLHPDIKGTRLFNDARNEVRWAYQKLVIEDFLPRIVKGEVLADLQKAKSSQERQGLYALYTEDKRINLPREFVVAAYRFGHSGVRFGYRLNSEPENRFSIFAPKDDPTNDRNLLGFDPLPKNQVIDDWGRFFPSTLPTDLPPNLGPLPTGTDGLDPNPAVRLQFAYKIDTTLVEPLTVLPPSVLPTSPNPGGAIQEVQDAINSDPFFEKPLPGQKPLPDPKRPSLALLNLLRGNVYKVQSGQAIARVLKEKGFREGEDKGFAPVEPLDPKYLVTRQLGTQDKTFVFQPIGPELLTDTPLWFYILAEAQQSILDELEKLPTPVDPTQEFPEDLLLEPTVAKTQLGWVGGRIVAEVFYGLLDSDTESYVHLGKDWKPIWARSTTGCSDVIFADLLKFAGQHITPTP